MNSGNKQGKGPELETHYDNFYKGNVVYLIV